MKKKNIAGFVCGALVSAALLVLGTCETVSGLVSEPGVSFNSVSLRGLRFSGADMLAKINVQNDNSFAIPFPEVDWELFVSGNAFLSGTVKNSRKIAPRSTTVVEIPFSVPYEGLYKTMSNLINAGEAPYTVKVGVRFPIPVVENKTFRAEFGGTIPLLKIPSLSFDRIRFNSLSPSKVEFVLTWSVENKNSFPIRLDSLGYDFAVNGSSWTKGQVPEGLNLAPGKTTQVPVTVSLSALSLIRDIAALAGSGKTAAFTCTGEASLRPLFEGLEAFSIPFNFAGNTNFRN
ncbi:MAG: LEA type 2 family protein [Spirochaetaceae bacterium]|nr:LEA type 2 family protein [Spirochaetaceae bacterium]